jgi:hypothetical protein
MAWKRHLQQRIAVEARDQVESRYAIEGDSSYLALDLKPECSNFEANEPSRYLSIRRAATLGPKTQLRQVIINNTLARVPSQHEINDQIGVTRSKSYMSSTHLPTLAPRRSERVRLESILADVWSRHSLPYPGMAMRRPENAIRASANSVMRKLSMASIASNFSKRSASFSGPNGERLEDMRHPPQRTFYNTATRSRRAEKRRSRAVVVDFHSTPSAFLPEDFELKKPTLTIRGQRFVRRAMTMEGYKTHPQMQPPPPPKPPMHRRAVSVSMSIDLRAPAPTPLYSEDSGHFSDERPAATVRTDVPGLVLSTPASTPAAKGSIKMKSKLFKLLGVKD